MTLLFLNLWLFFSFVLVLHYVFWHGEIVACTTTFLSSSLLALRLSPSYSSLLVFILKFDMSHVRSFSSIQVRAYRDKDHRSFYARTS